MEILYTDNNGVTTKFTEDMAISAIKERDELREQLTVATNNASRQWDKVQSIRTEVYQFFAQDYDPNATEMTISIDDINNLLESIGCDKLKRYFTVSGTINFTIVDIEATDADEARDVVEKNMTLDFDGGQVDDWDLDVRDVSEQ